MLAAVFAAMIIINFLMMIINKNEVMEQKVFDVNIEEAYILTQELDADVVADTVEGLDHLVLKVSIENNTDQDYKNVEYYIGLNEEVKPYVASGIIEFHQEKMDVLSKGKINELKEKGELYSGETPAICGFEHEWNIPLTNEVYLKNHFKLSPDGLENALQSMTVMIRWDGGKQTEIVPVHLMTDSIDFDGLEVSQVKNISVYSLSAEEMAELSSEDAADLIAQLNKVELRGNGTNEFLEYSGIQYKMFHIELKNGTVFEFSASNPFYIINEEKGFRADYSVCDELSEAYNTAVSEYFE